MLVKISDAIWMQIAVSVVGIAMLTAVAYYRSWSKKVDKPKSPAVPDPGSAHDERARGEHWIELRASTLGSSRYHRILKSVAVSR